MGTHARGPMRSVLGGPALGLLLGVVLFGAATKPERFGPDDVAGGHGEPPSSPGHGWNPTEPAPLVEPSPALGLALAGVALGVALRRRCPPAAFALVVVATAGYLALGGPAPLAFVAPALALPALARVVPPRRWILAATAFVPMLVAAESASRFAGMLDPSTWLRFVFALAVLVVPTLIGQTRDARRAAAARDRAAQLQRVADDERLRMARDIHDVVGHGLSTISLQSGVALHVLDSDPAQARACLEAIRAASAASLSDVRAAIGVLRTPGETGPLHPTPGLGDLAGLAAPVQAAGGRVTVRADPPPDGAGGSQVLGQAAYRVVQEGLTNAARHAPGADVEVDVCVDPAGGDALVVDIADDGPPLPAPPTPGNGLRGMRERVEALRGTLTVEPRPGGGLHLRARLPLHPPGAAAREEAP